MSTPPDTTTRHEYTDAEIIKAACNAIQAPNMGTFTLPWFRAFLSALSALPERPQAAEIAELKAERDKWEADALRYCKNAEFWSAERDKAQGILKACLSVMPFGNIETHTVENLPGRIPDLASEIASLGLENERIETELAALRQSTQSAQPTESAQTILADDGRSLGQVAMKASFDADTDGLTVDECYDAAAQAVAAVVLAQAVRRMEAVPVDELEKVYWDGNEAVACYTALKRVRARLIAAAKGEGQAHPVGVNEPPKDEKQPDLSGESEKQDLGAMVKAAREAAIKGLTGPAWIPHDGGPCPLKDEEVEVVEIKYLEQSTGREKIFKEVTLPPNGNWRGITGFLKVIAYRVLKWKLGFGQEAKVHQEPAQPWTPDNAKAYEDFQAELRETWAAQPWTPAVGDTVRLKSGGPVMTVVETRQGDDVQKSHVVWITEEGRVSGIESLSAACLTPAKEGQP